MLTYNMDVEPRSTWLRTTPGAAALAQPYYCTEAGIFYGRQHFSTARTDKESYILFYTRKGVGLVEQNGEQVLLPAGMALLLNCRTPQSYCTAPGQRCWHHNWVHLDGAGVRAMEEILIPGRRLTPAPLPQLEADAAFDGIFAHMQAGTTAAMVQTCLALHQLLADLARQHLAETANATGRVLVERAAEHIRRHYAEPLSLETLLADAHVGKSYFLRLFRQHMGTTPYNFLLCTRITQAKELLVLTDLPVVEVARRTGFNSESNFSTRFAAMTGQSPLNYRKSSWKPQG